MTLDRFFTSLGFGSLIGKMGLLPGLSLGAVVRRVPADGQGEAGGASGFTVQLAEAAPEGAS